MRFRCLLKHRVLHYKPDMASRIINSCVILHNMCIEEKVPLPQDVEVDYYDFGMNVTDNEHENLNERRNRVNPELTAGRRLQERLIRNLFAEI